MILALLLLAAAQTETKKVTISVTLPVECPVCEKCPSVKAPAKCMVVENIKWFEHCATGPKRKLDDSTGRDVWGYWGPLSEECTLLGGQIYAEVCRLLDEDKDGDVDLKDLAVWMNER